jgi:hypothetical protein
MRLKSMTAEAAECRQKADDFADRPEGAFLLQLASAWEELALVQSGAKHPSESRPHDWEQRQVDH